MGAYAPHNDHATMNEKTKRLRDLMTAHKMTAADVGEILHRKPHTVHVWMCDARVIPADALRVLELELARRGVGA
jgi:hypothetical protein